MSEPTATIPQIAEIVQLLGTSPTRASTVLSILAHVGYNSESTPAASKAVSIVDESTAVERVAEYSALPVLPAWFDALKEHADFFPTGLDRAPTCGSPKYSATIDTEIIHNWSGQYRTAGFSARIRRRSRLLVIDLDQKNGQDGFTSLGYVLLDHNIELPAGPVVKTPHGGRHLYMLRPIHSPKVVSQVGIWGGVDIMAEKGQCILPGSKIRDGEYQLVEGDLENIPYAPLALLKVIHDRQKEQKVEERRARQRSRVPLPFNDAPACLTPRERVRLFRNKVFRSFWNMGKEEGDTSLSAYEFHLAKACFCVGLSTDQTETVIKWWWKHHNLTDRSEKKLVKAIIPAAWRDVAEYVVGWKAAHRGLYTITCITTERETANPKGRPLSARTLLVLRLADENPGWSVGKIASAAVVSLKSAWIALHRHRPGRVHATTCITTEVTPVLAIEAVPVPAVDDEVEIMTPEDVMMDLDYLDAEYAAAVSAGMFEDGPEIEAIEEIEAPVLVMRPAAAVIKATLPDFNDYVEPELVTVESIGDKDILIDYTGDSSAMYQPSLVNTRKELNKEEGFRPQDIARYRRETAEWDIKWKKEELELQRKARACGNGAAQLKRHAAAKKRIKVYASMVAPTQQDLDLERLYEMYHGKKDTS